MIGTGISKGMAGNAQNVFGSYFEKERLTTVRCPGGARTLFRKIIGIFRS